ncbi:metal-dependent hydrolase [Chloroflexus sp.]|uniref:metal-dependent hydrolase n=1 Tax=Chloroflexus sp. TaxID=1904827 RepID=UPI002ACDB171|nr:metal-dependent hydrolase [Chloroflexus sp.]
MSGFQTHAFVGAVSGLALVTLVETVRPELLPERIGMMPPIAGVPGGAGGAAVIVASAFLALIPDIDEPNSFISRRVREVLTLAGVALGLALGVVVRGPAWLPLATGAVGGAVGMLAGWALLKVIRGAAGGHRRLTHSFVLAGLLAALAWALALAGAGLVWLVPAALAWGIVIHCVGDLVTPAGVPLLFPLSDAKIRVMPEPMCRYGEALIFLVASGVGWLLLNM